MLVPVWFWTFCFSLMFDQSSSTSSLPAVSLLNRVCCAQVDIIDALWPDDPENVSWLMKVCSLLVMLVVVLQVSDLYNSTDLTLELNIYSLVLSEMFLVFQTLFSTVKVIFGEIAEFYTVLLPLLHWK